MSRHALLDGDAILYRIAASMEKTLYGISIHSKSPSPDPFWEFDNHREARIFQESRSNALMWKRKETGQKEEAITRLRVSVNEIMATTGARDLAFVVSGPRNFRDQIGTIRKYKGNRDATARPALLADLVEFAENEYPGFIRTDNMEADDLISIMARVAKPSSFVIVGSDKDLLQIPGPHYDWVSGQFSEITAKEGLTRLYKQVLMGDPADNICGCWRVGPAKAESVARAFFDNRMSISEIWSAMVQSFENSQKLEGCPYIGLDPEDVAEEMYLLVHLLEYSSEAEDILRDRLCEKKNNNQSVKERLSGEKKKYQEKSACAPSATEPESTKSDCSESRPAQIAAV